MRTGEVEKGLRQMRKAYEKEQSASHIMELGVAYLWVKNYKAAWEHFRLSIAEYPNTMSGFYGMAGVAKWCLGEPAEAVRQWSTGLKADYADTAGLGIRQPLLLYVASVLEPGSYSKASAEAILKDKAKDRRVDVWPGPIVRWLLDQISTEELRERCAGTYDRHWLADFYAGVCRHAEGKQTQFKKVLWKLVDTTRLEWSQQDFFLARMWSEEFFIARQAAPVFLPAPLSSED